MPAPKAILVKVPKGAGPGSVLTPKVVPQGVTVPEGVQSGDKFAVLQVPENAAGAGTVIQLGANWGPAVQVTVPEGKGPSDMFAVQPGSVKLIRRFETGGGWRHNRKELHNDCPFCLYAVCCSPCFIAKTLAILRTGDANAKYFWLNIPCRNCCAMEETACSIMLKNVPVCICWCCCPTEGIKYTEFYKSVREQLEIPHEAGCCDCLCESHGSHGDIAQIYLELRSRAQLTVDTAAAATVRPAEQQYVQGQEATIYKVKASKVVDVIVQQALKMTQDEAITEIQAPDLPEMTR